MSINQGQQLEIYSSNHPQEVLLVKLKIDDELDEVMIFKGFSSSLMRSTAFDPDVPVISDRAEILTIDRLAAPYKPNQPNYLQQGITWKKFQDYAEIS
ncbi:MAG: hypothetical protein ACK6CP_18400 [Pseudanabaena sp.]|jgi:hypothetical protein|nr:hypothetical protein [Pseudanabaena sp. M109S1SP2A07QC]MCA6519075.1 hypothetical protein [Pseudanabaena sp. M110S1SP2A07QC]MCA6522330.1 hypothetical protein [Pseudanabaena sp. M051S1SP2A07QC]MCA6527816.1 hypothetical protein [Pseudanabaena sp. M179S2SP2A07QC]MCA6529647.1 hypothetical protein [Pseudanabaena sp. M125S2SP2A07QC]MCA6536790.1 hypothetical protein [Pseudanabaena sp. M176S2SP2A07QC]MCA6538501.1 hypothetical protein [Pseudanabaena sp. M037S2SP2A07QC]MCA6544505.1 hypothetical prot